MNEKTIYVVEAGMSHEGASPMKAFISEVSANDFAKWCEGEGACSIYGGADYYFVTELEISYE